MFSIRGRPLPAYGDQLNTRSPRSRLRDRVSAALAVLVLVAFAVPVAGASAALKSGTTLISEWSAEDQIMVVQESDRKINFKGRWSTVGDQGYLGGKAKETGASAKAGFRFSGAAVAWIGAVGPRHGTANVYIDGRLSKIVDTWASSAEPSVVLFQQSWTSVGTHNISIVASSTAGHPAITLDAFLVRVSVSGGEPAPTPTPTPRPTPTPTPTPRPTPTPTPPPATPTPTPTPRHRRRHLRLRHRPQHRRRVPHRLPRRRRHRRRHRCRRRRRRRVPHRRRLRRPLQAQRHHPQLRRSA